ncbi:MAG: translation elongation factor Ts [Victivallales bacterium]|nr:translation elongation factor Ts [Victivallales bacterium]
MAEISAKEVVALRQKTGCGMMECKKALVECNGDVEGALEWLRKAGIAKAAKRAERSANQGKWAVATNGKTTVLVEGLCETDFVAKTPDFAEFVNLAAQTVLAYDVDGDCSEKAQADMDAATKALIGKLGENMRIRRAIRWTASDNGKIGTYVHPAQPFAAMVQVEGECSDELLNNLCLHVTASNPQYICSCEIPQAVIDKETEIALAQPELQGKPENILQGIIKGKMAKMYKEICLMDQPWIDDEKSCLAKVAPGLKVVRFVRWLAGENQGEN